MYYVYFVVFVFVILVMYAIRKQSFWINIPYVSHGVSRWIKNGIVNNRLPIKCRKCNLKNIETRSDFSSLRIQQMVHFIRKYFLKDGSNQYLPELIHVEPYFSKHDEMSFISFYKRDKEKIHISISGESIFTHKEIIGCISSRPAIMSFSNKAPLLIYYVDYLCIIPSLRKKGIAQELMTTHFYNTMHNNKRIQITMFKRETTLLKTLVPLLQYNTYCFDMLLWKTSSSHLLIYDSTRVDVHNFYIFYNYFCEFQFDLKVMSSLSNLLELINTNNILIYMLLDRSTKQIYGCYIFQVSRTFLEKNAQIITCIASLKSKKISSSSFVIGFKHTLGLVCQCCKHEKLQYIAIEDVSHNHPLIVNLLQKNTPILISPTAYYLVNYNYCYNISADRFLLVN